MRKEKKIKTGFFSSASPLLVPPRRHYSTLRNLSDPSSKVVTFLLEDLLDIVYQQQRKKARFVSNICSWLQGFEHQSDSYFALNLPQQQEVISICDEQPQADNARVLEVVPAGHLQTIVKVPAGGAGDELASSLLRSSVLSQEQKKEREILVSKLKREYLATVKAKYLSQSRPLLGQQRDQGEQEHMIELMRRNITKKTLPKKSSKKIKYWTDENGHRRDNKMATAFKKSKDFIDKIDPTNSMYNKSEATPKEEKPQRMSVCFWQKPYFLEESVTAKLTNLSEVSNFAQVKKEDADFIGPGASRLSKQLIKLPRISGIKESRSKVDLSFHSNRMNLRSIHASEHKNRPKNSMSLGQLPKINRH